jgi:hypothetical protein
MVSSNAVAGTQERLKAVSWWLATVYMLSISTVEVDSKTTATTTTKILVLRIYSAFTQILFPFAVEDRVHEQCIEWISA